MYLHTYEIFYTGSIKKALASMAKKWQAVSEEKNVCKNSLFFIVTFI